MDETRALSVVSGRDVIWKHTLTDPKHDMYHLLIRLTAAMILSQTSLVGVRYAVCISRRPERTMRTVMTLSLSSMDIFGTLVVPEEQIRIRLKIFLFRICLRSILCSRTRSFAIIVRGCHVYWDENLAPAFNFPSILL